MYVRTALAAIVFTLTTSWGIAVDQRVAGGFGQGIPFSPAFESNTGQAEQTVRYLCHSPGASVLLRANEVELILTGNRGANGTSKSKTASIRMQLVGARKEPELRTAGETPGKLHYFKGSDPSKWRTNISRFDEVRYVSIYPGVDLVIYVNGPHIEYDFEVSPGADPRQIRLLFEGHTDIQVNGLGDLVIQSAAGNLVQRAPNIYQMVGRDRIGVAGRYEITQENSVTFQVGNYDRSQILVIDPVIDYVTHIGGGGSWSSVGGTAGGLAGDSNGNVYFAGSVTGFLDPNLTLSAGALGSKDVLVSKLSPNGELEYVALLGGEGNDYAQAVAVDAQGLAYVVGNSDSADFPRIGPASEFHGYADAFVVKLSEDGSVIQYSTLIGGVSGDQATDIAVDGAGKAYVVGRTNSEDFVKTAGSFQEHLGGSSDGFLTRMAVNGSIEYSTFFGGAEYDLIHGIALDQDSCILLVGQTSSPDFPTKDALQADLTTAGQSDAFVAKFDHDGYNLVFSTFLGCYGTDVAYGVATDSSGWIYLTGQTESPCFPTYRAMQPEVGSTSAFNKDGFVVKLDADGQSFAFSTYLGGSSRYDSGKEIIVSPDNRVFVLGTGGDGFPVEDGLAGTTFSYLSSPYVVEIPPEGDILLFSSPLGSGNNADPYGIVADIHGKIHIGLMPRSTTYLAPFLEPGEETVPYSPYVVSLDFPRSGDPPFAFNQFVQTGEGTAVDINLTGHDNEGDSLSFVVTANPSNGSLSGSPPNLVYQPDFFFLGSDAFSFRVSDGSQFSNAAVVSIEVQAFGGSVRDLGTLGGGSSQALDVNEVGQVVGWAELADGKRRAFLWTVADEMIEIGSLGGDNSAASGISEDGTVVGFSETEDGDIHAFKWTASGGFTDLGSSQPGAELSGAFGLNDSGIIVGSRQPSGAPSIAHEFGFLGDLGTLGGDSSVAYDVNNAAAIQIVGESEDEAGNTHGFLWQEICYPLNCVPVFTDLGTLGGDDSWALAVNDQGTVIGGSEFQPGSPIFHAFVWNQQEGLLDLSVLGGYSSSSEATDVNEHDTVVGRSGNALEQWAAFIWTEGDGMRELPNLGGGFAQAFAINNQGTVVGASNATPKIPAHAVIWDLLIPFGDLDRDGLLNKWELEGYDADGDGVIDVDLPRMGADPFKKDVFVEIDYMRLDQWELVGDTYMEPHSDRPPQESIDRVAEVFWEAPVLNPDGSTGIHLHVDNGPESTMNFVTGETWGERSGSSAVTHSWKVLPPRDDWPNPYFTPERVGLFRHAYFVHRMENFTGLAAGIPSDRLIIGMAGSYDDVYRSAAVFMHELGHTIGLPHGPDHSNYDVNHLSIMNYLYTGTGITYDGAEGHLDYSRFNPEMIPDIDTSSIDEAVGISLEPELDNVGYRWECPRGTTVVPDPQDCYQIPPFTNIWCTRTSLDDWFDSNCNRAQETDADIGEGTYRTQDDWNGLDLFGGLQPFLQEGFWGYSNVCRALQKEDLEVPRPFAVSIDGPGGTVQGPGTLVTYDFAVKNVGHKSDEFAIEASSSLGWGDLSSLPSSVVLSPDEVIDFSVPVTIPMVPRGTTDHLKLRAQSVTNPRMASVKTTFTIAAAQVPSADAGPDQKVEANESGDASVFLDGSNSLSPTGDPLEFFWSGPFEDGGGTSSEESPSVSLRVGIHTISLVVGDGVVWSSADTVTITVVPSPTVVPACVESQGYWKNKPSEWPLGELTIGYMTYSQPEAMDILHQPVRGNGLVSLSKQLIAAKLNQARLIWVPEDVQTAILAADELIGPRIVPPIGSDKVKTRETGALNDLLDTYNSGQHEEGPYSCEE